MADILSIGGKPTFDDRIVKLETHTYNPYVNTTFGYSDEIRIPIQQQDLYTLPCESFLYVEGKFIYLFIYLFIYFTGNPHGLQNKTDANYRVRTMNDVAVNKWISTIN